MRTVLIIGIVMVVSLVLYACKAGQPQPPQEQTQEQLEPVAAPGFAENPNKDAVITLVNNAVAEVAAKGAEAFDEFRQKDSPWFQGDRYVFVWGIDGMRYCYPPDVSGEGKNMADLCDPAGRPIGRQFISTAQCSSGEGWVHYQWPKPDGTEAEWKSAYIRKAVGPDGTEYLVGSGLYKGDAN